jgi:hypothetical protein
MSIRNLMIPVVCVAIVGCDQKAGAPAVEIDRTVQTLKASELGEDRQEAEAWERLGIVRSRAVVAPQGVDHQLVLEDVAGRSMGTVSLQDDLEEGNPYEQRVSVTVAGETLVVEMGQATAGFRISHPASGRAGLVGVDLEAKQLVVDDMAKALRVEFADLLSIATAEHTGIFRTLLESEEVKKTVETCDSSRADGLTSCTGGWEMGVAIGASRFQCCYIVNNVVANACTNHLCIGCCDKGPCETWGCAAGDGICVCTMSGRRCGNW